MATSGTSTFNATRNEIIRHAALLLGVIGATDAMQSILVDDFQHALNGMLKLWQTDINLWTQSEATLFPQPGQVKYGVGTGATDHVTETYHETAITADEAAGQTTLSLDSTASITALDNIGIVLDDGTLQWTTVTSKTSSTVLVAAALTDSAAAGNAVFTYTSKIVQPLKVIDARRYNINSGTDTSIMMVARSTYQQLPLKLEAGNLNQVFYDRQLSLGYMYLWQVPIAVTDLVKFTWRRPIQDFSASNQNPDLPQEFILAIEYNLACVMAPQFHVPPGKYAQLERKAAEFLMKLTGFNREDESVYAQPDFD